MNEEKPKTCQFCRFWRALVPLQGEAEGECHRFPPVAQGKGFLNPSMQETEDAFLNQGMQVPEDAHIVVWVHTKPDDWCGEWAG